MAARRKEAGLIAGALNIHVGDMRRDVKIIFCHDRRGGGGPTKTSTEQRDPVSRRLPSLVLLRTQHRWEPET